VTDAPPTDDQANWQAWTTGLGAVLVDIEYSELDYKDRFAVKGLDLVGKDPGADGYRCNRITQTLIASIMKKGG
jgi:hypothetical protein